MISSLNDLKNQVKKVEKKLVAIASADEKILEVVDQCVKEDLADFILIGDEELINDAIKKNDYKFKCKIIHTPNEKAAAEKAVQLVKNGEAQIIMKGLLHTSTFMKAVLNKETGINTGKMMTQVSVYDKEYGDGIQLLTDCAMIIQPDLMEKKNIIENAVELAHGLGIELPKVALLSAVEVVNPKIPDTLDAAVLSKMADRGQIKGAIVDGPLALDNAISPEAAAHKGIKSEVAGVADVLVVPNLQVGNVLGKSLFYFAKKETATAIMGTTAPIVMTSRTDLIKNKVISVVLACYMAK